MEKFYAHLAENSPVFQEILNDIVFNNFFENQIYYMAEKHKVHYNIGGYDLHYSLTNKHFTISDLPYIKKNIDIFNNSIILISDSRSPNEILALLAECKFYNNKTFYQYPLLVDFLDIKAEALSYNLIDFVVDTTAGMHNSELGTNFKYCDYNMLEDNTHFYHKICDLEYTPDYFNTFKNNLSINSNNYNDPTSSYSSSLTSSSSSSLLETPLKRRKSI
jgi:hypothetical protein